MSDTLHRQDVIEDMNNMYYPNHSKSPTQKTLKTMMMSHTHFHRLPRPLPTVVVSLVHDLVPRYERCHRQNCHRHHHRYHRQIVPFVGGRGVGGGEGGVVE